VSCYCYYCTALAATSVPGLVLVLLVVCALALFYILERGPSSSQLRTRSSSSSSSPAADTGAPMPGPSGWPIIGSTLDVDVNYSHLTLEKWARQYGGLYQVKIAGDKWVVPAKYEYIHEVLVDKAHAFAGRFKTFRVTVSCFVVLFVCCSSLKSSIN
jgi:hypothetical protein